MHAIMKHWHPMLGRDLHIPWPPGSPAPAPSPVPYVTFSTLLGLGVTALYAPTHQTQGLGMTMQVGTDIGPGIPHVGVPSVTLPLEIILSSSKSYFGPSNHLAEGKPICAALLGHTNPNLDCGTPVPAPFGLAMALNTHYVSMSLADILGGAAAMLSDWAIQSALQYLGGRAATRIGNFLSGRIASRVFQRTLFRGLMRDVKWPETMALLARFRWERRADALGEAAGQLIGFFTGGPMGIDAGTFGLWTPGGALGDGAQERSRAAGEQIGQAISDYLNSPGTEGRPIGDFPTPSGDSAVA